MALAAPPAPNVPPPGNPAMKKEPVALRLDRSIDRSAGDDACWPWKAYRNRDGYGVVQLGGRPQIVTRVVWEHARGALQQGLCVLHRCDNPACCNLAHLWLGTRADNNADRDAKGRCADRRGEKGGGARLTRSQIIQIRSDVGTHASIALRFGVSRPLISQIRAGKKWRHVREIESGGDRVSTAAGGAAGDMSEVQS